MPDLDSTALGELRHFNCFCRSSIIPSIPLSYLIPFIMLPYIISYITRCRALPRPDLENFTANEAHQRQLTLFLQEAAERDMSYSLNSLMGAIQGII